ncbi:hypothetical protein INT47_010216 [Mucor saturninus]|uniref:C2H2-type domain-containing protein n=1 Tax=Mucor saturninus TaxID=64648 RepID=A0A8H7V618_9FUNG|nr:hypothetical protein INT47_010216 [Mucor saturninus]
MYSNNYQPTFDLTSHLSPSDLEFDRCLNTNYQQQRSDSIDYSRRPSYFTGLLSSNNNSSEASYSDGEQQTPSPFNSYEDYQYHHPLDNSNNKRRLSTLVELPHLSYPQQASMAYHHGGWMGQQNVATSSSSAGTDSPQRCNSSPMIYANPAVDMYSPQTYLTYNHHSGGYPLVDNVMMTSLPSTTTADGIYRERASSSSSSSSSSDSALSVSPPPSSRRTSKVNLKSPLKPTRSRGRRVSNSPSIAGQKVFTCKQDDCGKVFKRSEHLKRHVRSIHTLEKPFECPYHSCSKRFSRSDNLNQHIRIHRHTGKDKNNNSSPTASSTTAAVRNNSFSNNYMPTY